MKFFATATIVLALAAIFIGVWVESRNTMPEVGALQPYVDAGAEYIFIFSPTCPHCIASFPVVKSILDAGHNLATICLGCDDAGEDLAREFMQANSLSSVPLTLKIEGGKIVWMFTGALDSSNFQIQGAP